MGYECVPDDTISPETLMTNRTSKKSVWNWSRRLHVKLENVNGICLTKWIPEKAHDWLTESASKCQQWKYQISGKTNKAKQPCAWPHNCPTDQSTDWQVQASEVTFKLRGIITEVLLMLSTVTTKSAYTAGEVWELRYDCSSVALNEETQEEVSSLI